MRRKTSPRPIERADRVRPLASATVGASLLPTAAALAAALFAIGCGAQAESSIHADHDRGRVLATSDTVKGEGKGDGVKPGMGTPIDPLPVADTAVPVVVGPPPHPLPVPIPHGGKVAPIKPTPIAMPGGLAPIKTAGGPAPMIAGTSKPVGAGTTPPR